MHKLSEMKKMESSKYKSNCHSVLRDADWQGGLKNLEIAKRLPLIEVSGRDHGSLGSNLQL